MSGGFFSSLSLKLSSANTFTWTNKWSATSTNQVGQTASASITGPNSSDNYTGPVEFNIFQDNVYGTFMFGFIPQPTFNVFASPSSQSVAQGSCASYTASVSALVSGFSSTVTFGVSGLPANATASFSPASVSGAGSSTMTVCAASSTPIGTRNLTITGTSGIEVHSTSVSLTVNQAGDFSLTASPASLAIVAGGASASSTITVSPLSGLTNPVSLSVNGGGLTATLSSTTITGSGSVTLTIKAGALVAGGNYVVKVTGVTGSISHTISISVTVDGGGGCVPNPKFVCD